MSHFLNIVAVISIFLLGLFYSQVCTANAAGCAEPSRDWSQLEEYHSGVCVYETAAAGVDADALHRAYCTAVNLITGIVMSSRLLPYKLCSITMLPTHPLREQVPDYRHSLSRTPSQDFKQIGDDHHGFTSAVTEESAPISKRLSAATNTSSGRALVCAENHCSSLSQAS